ISLLISPRARLAASTERDAMARLNAPTRSSQAACAQVVLTTTVRTNPTTRFRGVLENIFSPRALLIPSSGSCFRHLRAAQPTDTTVLGDNPGHGLPTDWKPGMAAPRCPNRRA